MQWHDSQKVKCVEHFFSNAYFIKRGRIHLCSVTFIKWTKPLYFTTTLVVTLCESNTCSVFVFVLPVFVWVHACTVSWAQRTQTWKKLFFQTFTWWHYQKATKKIMWTICKNQELRVECYGIFTIKWWLYKIFICEYDVFHSHLWPILSKWDSSVHVAKIELLMYY